MRHRLLVAATVGSIALGSLVVLLGVRLAGGLGAGGTPASPTASALGSPQAQQSPTAVEPSVVPTLRPPPTPAPVTPTKAVVATLQGRLDVLRRSYAIPGVSVSIVFSDGSSWNGVSGLADVARERRVTTNTAFSVASISKTFLAALMLDLAAEGRLRLDDRASRYLPEQKILTGTGARITIRMLLDHTSGLHDYFLNAKIDRALRNEPSRGWSPTRTLGYVAKAYFPPGTDWQYSNTNYLLLGLIAERIQGRPLAEQLRTRYFEPFGLESAFSQVAERPRGATAHGYRFAGTRKNLPAIDLADGTGIMPFKSVITAAGGAGSVAATSADMARWARALYSGRVLDVESTALMLGGFDRVAVYRPAVPYGLGVQALEINGRRTLGHSGRFLGFRAVVRYLPKDGVAIAVLTNQSRIDPAAIVADLLRFVVPPPVECGPCAQPL